MYAYNANETTHSESEIPWYQPLCGSFWSISGFRQTHLGRICTHGLVCTMELLRIAPKGSAQVSGVCQQCVGRAGRALGICSLLPSALAICILHNQIFFCLLCTPNMWVVHLSSAVEFPDPRNQRCVVHREKDGRKSVKFLHVRITLLCVCVRTLPPPGVTRCPPCSTKLRSTSSRPESWRSSPPAISLQLARSENCFA